MASCIASSSRGAQAVTMALQWSVRSEGRRAQGVLRVPTLQVLVTGANLRTALLQTSDHNQTTRDEHVGKHRADTTQVPGAGVLNGPQQPCLVLVWDGRLKGVAVDVQHYVGGADVPTGAGAIGGRAVGGASWVLVVDNDHVPTLRQQAQAGQAQEVRGNVRHSTTGVAGRWCRTAPRTSKHTSAASMRQAGRHCWQCQSCRHQQSLPPVDNKWLTHAGSHGPVAYPPSCRQPRTARCPPTARPPGRRRRWPRRCCHPWPPPVRGCWERVPLWRRCRRASAGPGGGRAPHSRGTRSLHAGAHHTSSVSKVNAKRPSGSSRRCKGCAEHCLAWRGVGGHEGVLQGKWPTPQGEVHLQRKGAPPTAPNGSEGTHQRAHPPTSPARADLQG